MSNVNMSFSHRDVYDEWMPELTESPGANGPLSNGRKRRAKRGVRKGQQSVQPGTSSTGGSYRSPSGPIQSPQSGYADSTYGIPESAASAIRASSGYYPSPSEPIQSSAYHQSASGRFHSTSSRYDPSHSDQFQPASSGYYSSHSDQIRTASSGNTFQTASARSNYSFQSAQSRQSLFTKAKTELGIEDELDWSGKGQHVSFRANEELPFRVEPNAIDKGSTAIIDIVQCRRIRLARKLIRCKRGFPLEEALREVSLLQKLRHAHIIQIVGSYYQGRDLGILLYPIADTNLSELLDEDSESLDEGVRNPASKSRERLWGVAGCLSHALKYIHRNNIKHLDVKPSNILVKRKALSRYEQTDEYYDHVYIADFGASKQFEDQSQTDNVDWQTPKYRSPEVADYENKGRASDIFSLGCVLVELLTVAAGISLKELRRQLWGTSHRQEYHLSINETRTWIDSVASRFDTSGPPAEIPRHEKSFEEVFRGAKLLHSMLDRDPKERPTSSQLISSFGGSVCCDVGPDPFVPQGKQLLEAAEKGIWSPVRTALPESVRSLSNLDWCLLANEAALQGQSDVFISLLKIHGEHKYGKSSERRQFLNPVINGLFDWEALFPYYHSASSRTDTSIYSFVTKGRDLISNWACSTSEINWNHRDGWELLFWACEIGRQDSLEDFLNKGGSTNPEDYPRYEFPGNWPDSLLYTAIGRREERIVRFLLKKGEDVEQQSKPSELLQLRINKSHDPGNLFYGSYDIQYRPLHHAVCHSDAGLSKIFLDHGADLNAPITLLGDSAYSVLNDSPSLGPTPLTLAIILGNYEMISLLLERGADVNIVHETGGTAVIHSVLRSNPDIFENLLKHGADINLPDRHGATPLMHASQNHAMMGKLLESGADPNSRDKKGLTALMYAIQALDEPLVNLLLAGKSDINVQDLRGATALFYTIECLNEDLFRPVLLAGADLTVRDRNDLTPLCFLLSVGIGPAAELKVRFGDENIAISASWKPRWQVESDPLDGTAWGVHCDIEKFAGNLFELGAKFDSKDYSALKHYLKVLSSRRWQAIIDTLGVWRIDGGEFIERLSRSSMGQEMMRTIADVVYEKEGLADRS